MPSRLSDFFYTPLNRVARGRQTASAYIPDDHTSGHVLEAIKLTTKPIASLTQICYGPNGAGLGVKTGSDLAQFFVIPVQARNSWRNQSNGAPSGNEVRLIGRPEATLRSTMHPITPSYCPSVRVEIASCPRWFRPCQNLGPPETFVSQEPRFIPPLRMESKTLFVTRTVLETTTGLHPLFLAGGRCR